MAYLNDPRENRFGPNGELWENDNRVETRYRWNGAFVDLCDLPPEEYVKTIFVTRPEGGVVPPGPQPPVGPVNNPIVISVVRDDTKAIYSANASDKVASELKVKFTLEGNPVELTIKQGKMVSNTYSYPAGPDVKLPAPEGCSSMPEEDKSFIYKVVTDPTPGPSPEVKTFLMFAGSSLVKTMDSFDGPEAVALPSVEVDKEKGASFKMVVPAVEDQSVIVDNFLAIAMPSKEYGSYDILETSTGFEVPKTDYFQDANKDFEYLGQTYKILTCVGGDGEFASEPAELIFDYKIKRK